MFGVIASNKERAQHDLRAAELLGRQQTLLKLHQAANAYSTLQSLIKQKAALAQSGKRVDATYRRVRKEFELGKAAGVEARYAESEVARLAADTAVLDGALSQAQADFAEATGQAGFLPTVGEIRVPTWEAPADVPLPVQIAQARQQSAQAQAEESRLALLPSLSLDANYFRNSVPGSDHRNTWAIGGVLSLPLGVAQYRQAGAQKLAAAAAAEQSTGHTRLTLPVVADVLALRDTLISSRLSAYVTALPLFEGGRFKRGDLLARLDMTPSASQGQANSLATELAAAESTLKTEQERLRRAEALYEIQGISQEQFQAAAAAAAAARSRHTVARENLRGATVTAPFAGVVSQRLAQPGDLMTPGKPMLKITDTSAGNRLLVNVPEAVQAAGLRVGDQMLPLTPWPESAPLRGAQQGRRPVARFSHRRQAGGVPLTRGSAVAARVFAQR